MVACLTKRVNSHYFVDFAIFVPQKESYVLKKFEENNLNNFITLMQPEKCLYLHFTSRDASIRTNMPINVFCQIRLGKQRLIMAGCRWVQ